MRRLTIAATLLLLAWVTYAGAQSTPSASSQTPVKSGSSEEGSANLGSVLRGKGVLVKLGEKIDTKRAKAGDEVTAEVTQDVKLGDQVLLQKGSLVKGTITQVQAFSKGKSGAELDIVFNNVIPKAGEQSSTHLLIFALSAKMDQAPPPEDIGSTKGKQGLANSAGISGQVGGPYATELTPETVGIFGFDDVELHPAARLNPPTSTINCAKRNIVFEKGTKMVLKFAGM